MSANTYTRRTGRAKPSSPLRDTVEPGEKLQKFYADIFGWHVNADNEFNYGLVDTHTDKGIGGGIGPTQGGPNMVTFYVDVDDLQKYLDKAEAMGGKTIMPPTELPQVTLALFADPEGNVIGMTLAGSGM